MYETHEVNTSCRRIRVEEKLNGSAVYGADLHLPHMLYAKGVTSGMACAEILAIHTDAARRIPGVRAVYTAKDIPGKKKFGIFCKDEQILAEKYVKCEADVIAVVLADTLESARKGVKAVTAELRELPPVLTVEEALAAKTVINSAYPDNICARFHVIKGDAAAALTRAAVVVDETYETTWVEHAYMEPEAIVIVPHEDGSVEMRGGTQNPFYNKQVLCDALCLPEQKVLVNPDCVGGSFGGKSGQIGAMAVRAALGAMQFGCPVSYVLDREESIQQSHKRHGIRTHIRLGADKDGTLVALDARAVMDAGAYVNESPIVTWKSINCGLGPYRLPDVYYDNTTVMTNNMVCGAMRGFGTPQAIFALESALNELAQRLHMNPMELRRRNFLREGDYTGNNQLLQGHVVSIRSVAERAARAIDFDQKFKAYAVPTDHPVKRGIGIACAMRGVSFGADSEDTGRAKVTILPDGTLELRCPIMEIGQGADTVLTQMCADAFQLPLSRVVHANPETSCSPDTGTAGASRGTFIAGNAILIAAEALRAKIALGYHAEAGCVEFQDGQVIVQGKPYGWDDVYRKLQQRQADVSVTGEYTVPVGQWDEQTCQGDAFISYVYSCHAAEVEVDTDTGQVKVLEMVGCHDCGRVVNPLMAEGQVTGGMIMGIGMALTEAVETDRRGIIKTKNFDSYILPTAKDACKMTVLFEENPDDCGPFGSKGLGEPAMEPAPAAISAAVNMALGNAGSLRKIPATLEDVFFAAHPGWK